MVLVSLKYFNQELFKINFILTHNLFKLDKYFMLKNLRLN
jgi:hypothetical protein